MNQADGCEIRINLIPHTVQVTTLKNLQAGTPVNLEIDMIARYVERNAQRAKLCRRAEAWPYGSLHRWLRGFADDKRLLSAPAAGIECPFPLDDHTRHRLLEGLDDVGLTLQKAEHIDAHEAGRPDWHPTTA